MNKENAVCNLKFLHPHNSSSLSAILNFSFTYKTKNSKLQHYTQPHSCPPFNQRSPRWRESLNDWTYSPALYWTRCFLPDVCVVFQVSFFFFLSDLKILSLDVFIVSILPHLYLLQPNQAFRVVLSTVNHAAWLISSLPIGGCYSIQPGSTTGLLGNTAACLAGTNPVWCNHWFKLCS